MSGDTVEKEWAEFEPIAQQMGKDGGKGLAVLSEATTSTTFESLKAKLPGAKFYQWESINDDAAIEGSTRAFGKPLRSHWDFSKAKVVCCLGADPLETHPNALKNARDWAAQRRGVDGKAPAMSRTVVRG